VTDRTKSPPAPRYNGAGDDLLEKHAERDALREQLAVALREALGGNRDHFSIEQCIEEVKEHTHVVLVACFGDVPPEHFCNVCVRLRENAKRREP